MTSLYVKCDRCGTELGMEKVFTGQHERVHWSRQQHFLEALAKLGWAVHGDTHFCPPCAEASGRQVEKGELDA